MSIETDARQEAERRWPALNPDAEELTYPRSAIRRMTRGSFIAGAVWAREQDTREPSDAEVEAAARKVFETDAPSHEPEEWFTVSPQLRNDYRATARAALLAAQQVRRG